MVFVYDNMGLFSLLTGLFIDCRLDFTETCIEKFFLIKGCVKTRAIVT